MLEKKSFIVTLLVSLCTTSLFANTNSVDLDELHGNWHLRSMDGKDVRKARAILDFDAKNMKLNGFDGCNRISSKLKTNHKTLQSTKIATTRMECREHIHSYVRTRLHKTVKEGFTVMKAKQNGVEGIVVKGSNHELFFKWMSS